MICEVMSSIFFASNDGMGGGFHQHEMSGGRPVAEASCWARETRRHNANRVGYNDCAGDDARHVEDEAMAEKRVEPAIERQQPDIREHIDGVKFHQLAKGITTHPLVRSGRPCIEGTGIMVTDIVAAKKYHEMEPENIANHFALELNLVVDALAYYAAHTDYIDTDLEIDGLNDVQLAEAQYGTRSDSLLSRRKPVP